MKNKILKIDNVHIEQESISWSNKIGFRMHISWCIGYRVKFLNILFFHSGKKYCVLQLVRHESLYKHIFRYILFTKRRGYSNIENYSSYQTNVMYLKQLVLINQVISPTI